MFRRIIGIDPGTYYTGYGVIEIRNNKSIKYINSGCIRNKSLIFIDRLKYMFFEIQTVLLKYKPLEVAIEKIFFFKNSNVSIKLSQLSGVIILAAAKNLLSVFEYDINIIRKSVFSKAKISKGEVNVLIKRILKIDFDLSYDITDALAVAVAHFNIV